MASIVAAVLLAVLTGGIVLFRDADSGQGLLAATSAQDQALSSPPAGTSSSAGADQTSDSAETSPPSTAGEAAASAFATAVSDYYALMPGNTDAGWARLTPAFQSGIARDREYYNSFWAGVERVAVSDVTVTGPSTVEATVTYTFPDGTVSVERTAYRLVEDGDVIKIDSSSVLSSRAG